MYTQTQSQSINSYLENSRMKFNEFKHTNTLPLSKKALEYKAFNNPQNANVVGCTDSYPSQYTGGILEDKSYIKAMNNYVPGSSNEQQVLYPIPINSNVNDTKNRRNIPQLQTQNDNPFHENRNNPGFFQGFMNTQNPNTQQQQHQQKEEFGNIDYSETNTQLPSVNQPKNPTVLYGNLGDNPNLPMKINDPTNDLLDIDSRPISDFIHNNMVPYYGSAVKQNMAGTGVGSGNYTDGIDVNSGFDYTSPFRDKLNNFTGLDDTYLHKREAGPNFSPAEQQMGWVYGMPAFRPDEDRYTQSIFTRNDLAPCEPELVGPGLDLDPSIPAAGGFHDPTRIIPNNVDDYKANQLEGRVKVGKFFSSGEPSAYPGAGIGGAVNGEQIQTSQKGPPGVVKNRPNKFWDQTRRPTMTTKSGFVENFMLWRPDYQLSLRPGNAIRDQTSVGFGELVSQMKI